ncbi:sugar phosphate isomerase/epimerase [Candidatus Gracilibacteria bacterium]|nr:sugar phosphate isomerase/epimerase [Candidatus Gracilibacteria bacterium]
MATSLPLVGAALQSKHLAEYADWLIADQRDLELQDPVSPDVLDGDWRTLASSVRSTLDGYKGQMGIHGPFLGFNLFAQDQKIRAAVVDRFLTALEFAAAVGATHMVLHSPFGTFGNPFTVHQFHGRLNDDITHVQHTVEPVLAAAQQIGCTLVIETIYDTNPALLFGLVRSFESEYVRLSIDVGHCFINSRFGGPPPDQWVRSGADLLAHLHLQDTDGHGDRHWAPGQGSLNWYALFEALRELAHTPRMVLELRDQSRVLEGARWLAERGLAR